MNKIILKTKLDELNIDDRFFSLNGELMPDRIVLLDMHGIFQVLYISERGDQDVLGVYTNEEAACNKVYELFLADLQSSGSTKKRLDNK